METSFFISARVLLLSLFLIAFAIQSAICLHSSSFMPRDVIVGVPIRMPEVSNGDKDWRGIVFLFTVIPAFPRITSASCPDML